MINKIYKFSSLFYKLCSIKDEYSSDIHPEELEYLNAIKELCIDIAKIGTGGINKEKEAKQFEKYLYYFDPDQKDSEIIKKVQKVIFTLRHGSSFDIANTIVLLWRYFYPPREIEDEADEYSGPLNDLLKGMSLVDIPGRSLREKAIICLNRAGRKDVKKFKLKNDVYTLDKSGLSKTDLDELVSIDPYEVLDWFVRDLVKLWPKTLSKLLDFAIQTKGDYYDANTTWNIIEKFMSYLENSADLQKLYDNFESNMDIDQLLALLGHEYTTDKLIHEVYNENKSNTGFTDTIYTCEWYLKNMPKDIALDIARHAASFDALPLEVQEILSNFPDEETQLNLALNKHVADKMIEYLSTNSPYESVRAATKETLEYYETNTAII